MLVARQEDVQMETAPKRAGWQDDALLGLGSAFRAALLAQSTSVKLPAGTVLFRPGDLCAQFPILLSGCLRVYRIARSGREMLLYRVGGGETCILTTACLLSSEAYAAGGTVEVDAQALVLSAGAFTGLMDRSADFRALVFAGYAARIADLMQRIEDLSDISVEVRLAARLLALSDANSIVPTTHQGLASDIGTAREVVSRSLERMVHMGLLRLSRGQVEIIDRNSLEAIARD